MGFPTMTNAANMAIRASMLYEINSTPGSRRSSGDDIFLLHALALHDPGSIAFCKDAEAIISTYPAPTLADFFNQRKRWAGKWSSYKSRPTILLAIYIYIINLVVLLLPAIVLLDYMPWLLAANLFLAKFLFEYFFLRQVQKFFNSRIHLLEFIILAIIYPVYVTLTGLIGSVTKYTWKNRRTR
jgi:hypothetical protein